MSTHRHPPPPGRRSRCCWATPTSSPRSPLPLLRTGRRPRCPSAGRRAAAPFLDHSTPTPPGRARRRLRGHVRPPQALLPVPDLLRPRRHPQTRHGPAAAQAGLHRRRAEPRRRRTARPPRGHAGVRRGRRHRRPDARCSVEHRAGLELLRLALRDADSPWADVLDSVSATLPPLPATNATPSPASPPRGRPKNKSASRRSHRRSTCPHREGPPMTPLPRRGRAPQHVTCCCGSWCRTSPSRSSSSATSGATATTSSAGPPAPPSSTNAGCCAWAARCSTSASCSSSLGHVGGLLIPEVLDQGASGSARPPTTPSAFSLGTVAGFRTLAGAAILIYRRRTVGPVFSATTRNDKAMYVLLIGTLRARPRHHRARQPHRPPARLPADRLALVPVDLLLPPRHAT